MTNTEIEALESRLKEEMRECTKMANHMDNDELATEYIMVKMKQHQKWATLINAVKKSRRPICAHCKRPL